MIVVGAIDSIRVDGCQGSLYARSREGVLAYEPGHPYIAVSPAPLHYGGNLLNRITAAAQHVKAHVGRVRQTL